MIRKAGHDWAWGDLHFYQLCYLLIDNSLIASAFGKRLQFISGSLALVSFLSNLFLNFQSTLQSALEALLKPLHALEFGHCSDLSGGNRIAGVQTSWGASADLAKRPLWRVLWENASWYRRALRHLHQRLGNIRAWHHWFSARPRPTWSIALDPAVHNLPLPNGAGRHSLWYASVGYKLLSCAGLQSFGGWCCCRWRR